MAVAWPSTATDVCAVSNALDEQDVEGEFCWAGLGTIHHGPKGTGDFLHILFYQTFVYVLHLIKIENDFCLSRNLAHYWSCPQSFTLIGKEKLIVLFLRGHF